MMPCSNLPIISAGESITRSEVETNKSGCTNEGVDLTRTRKAFPAATRRWAASAALPNRSISFASANKIDRSTSTTRFVYADRVAACDLSCERVQPIANAFKPLDCICARELTREDLGLWGSGRAIRSLTMKVSMSSTCCMKSAGILCPTTLTVASTPGRLLSSSSSSLAASEMTSSTSLM